MAFVSVISLKNIIERLLISSKIFVVPGSLNIIEITYKKLESLEDILKKLDSSSKRMDRKRVNALDEKIKEVVSKFEDLVESHLSDQFSSQSEKNSALLICIDLRYLTQDIDSFIKTAEKMEEEYVYELDNLVPEEEEDDDEETAEFGGNCKSKMVGFSDIVDGIRHDFTFRKSQSSLALSLYGMAGIGKTALAMEIFNDQLIMSHSECRAWVKVGRLFKLNEIPRSILRQVDVEGCREGDDDDDDDEKINQYLFEYLKDKRYLIVLDDVWETEVLEYLRCCFPKSDDVGSRIVITTRLRRVADHNLNLSRRTQILDMRLFNDEKSWNLFREKVFGEEWCPPKLEEAGKKIAKKCDGLPLTIVKVAELLTKREITVEYWNEVAADKEHSIFRDVYVEISKIISPSYDYLPQGLKPCILYMGIFQQQNDFSRSKLIDMWIAEGFLVPNIEAETLEESGTKCLLELVSNSLVMVCEKSTILGRGMKTCRLHASLWHFCRLEVRKNKFFTVLNSLADGSVQGLKGQRRLSIDNNILLGIKHVFGTIEEECAFTARSLLCLGPYHRYPLLLCFGLRFLRVLRALSIRLYEFPMEVLELVQLRYLALTFNGDLPASISRLFNLQFLIIHRHLSIMSSPSQSYLPQEIWDMKQLIYLHIMGSDLPEFTRPGSLENLRTLLDVGFDTCTEKVLQKISNLKKLGIRIELVPDDEIEFDPFHCLNRIFLLQKLESFKCVVVNPELKAAPAPEVVVDVAPPAPLSLNHISHLHDKLESPTTCIAVNPELKPEVVDVAPPGPRTFHLRKQESATTSTDVDPRELRLVLRPAPLSIFPSSLRKLHLSGLCCPWEYMDPIGSLPYLLVLKLQCYAFQGPKWKVERNKFQSIEFLVIDDADLVEWEVGSGSFSRLRNISIKHCYNLQDFHWDFRYYFKKVEIVDSNPSVKIFFDQLKDRRGGLRWGDVHRFGDVSSVSSWDDNAGKLKIKSSS